MAVDRTVDTGRLAFRAVEERLRIGHGGERLPLAERMSALTVPGAGIAVFGGAGAIAASGYGTTEAGAETPVTADTLFQAASISKAVTALAVLRLVEERRLDLDTDVNTYLRSWQVPAVWGWQPRVTPRQILSHSAGLTVHGFPGYERGQVFPTLVQILDGHPPANTAPVRVDSLPGVQWRYSGGGTTILQLLLADVTDRQFPDLMRDLVLDPLGMTQSTFEQPLPEGRWQQAATGHTPDGKPVTARWHVYPEMAAAGLWTTPSDLARFALGVLTAYADGPGSILRSETVEEMLRPQVSGFADPRVRFHDMGLGFFLGGEGSTLRFGHTGGNAGFRCLLAAYPATGGGVVVMTNSDAGWQLSDDVAATVAEACGWPDARGELPPPSAEGAATLVGSYEVRAGFRLQVTRDSDGLSLHLPGQNPLPLHQTAENTYAIGLFNAKLHVVRDASTITGVTVQQNVGDVTAERVLDGS